MPGRDIESSADRCEAVVLEIVLDHHPAHLSVEEVINEAAEDPLRFSDRTDTSEAIRDLVRTGLLHRSGKFVFATRAAVRVAELGI